MNLVFRKRRGDGVALIMALAFLVLISIIVLALLQGAKVERGAANSHLQGLKASLYSQMGLDQVMATIRTNTISPNPASASQKDAPYWITQPGQLIVAASKEDSRLKDVEPIPLSSGLGNPDAGGDKEFFKPANLNITTFRDPQAHLISENPESDGSGEVVKMYLKWIYVRKDGSRDEAEEPDSTNIINPIVGRYAFWVDDESSKINLNLAWTRSSGNLAASGSPTRVNLTALRTLASGGTPITENQADAIHKFVTPDGYRTINRLFDSPQAARAVSDDIADILQQNRFDVAYYNSDPDTTFFNQPRIVLTTQKKYSRGLPYLDILKNPGTDTVLGDDPGYLTSIDYTKLDKVIKRFVDPNKPAGNKDDTPYFQHTNWPMVTDVNATLQKKYFPTDSDDQARFRLAQIMVDIIDYVRSAESTKPLVEPLRVKLEGEKWIAESGAKLGGFLGHARGLLITEIGFWKPNTVLEGSTTDCKLLVELYLPKNYGLASVDLLNPEPGRKLGLFCYDFEDIQNPYEIKAEHISGGQSSIMSAGEYRTIVFPYKRRKGTSANRVEVRVGLAVGTPSSTGGVLSPGAGRLLFTPYLSPADETTKLVYPFPKKEDNPPEDRIKDEIQTLQIDDPRVSSIVRDWKLATPPTFGLPNENVSTLHKVPGGAAAPKPNEPEQDTDENGLLSDASLRMPKVRDPADARTGTVRSVGELGYITTGAFTRSQGSTSTFQGIPWRTMRLQPSKAGTAVIPDWAFMDLFTVPVEETQVAKEIFAPHGTSFAGRINLNSMAEPFEFQRSRPIVAALKGAVSSSIGDGSPDQKVTAQQAEEIAKNILQRTLSPGYGGRAGKMFGRENAYDSPGEVVEIKGVADRGEASEALVHEVANLFSVRGNVFNVYTIGQALKQTPDGKLVVLSESRQQNIVERYTQLLEKIGDDPSVLPKTETRCRSIFSQELNP